MKNKIVKLNVIKLISGYIDFIMVVFVVMGFLFSRFIIVDFVVFLGIVFFICVLKIDKYKIFVFILILLGILLLFNDFGNVVKYVVCFIIFMVMNKKLKLLDLIVKVVFIGVIILFLIFMG